MSRPLKLAPLQTSLRHVRRSAHNADFCRLRISKGSIQNGTIEGTWQADGKDRTVNINFTKTPPSTSYNNEFIEALNNAIFYQGDSNVLLLAPEGKKTYIQFAHNKQD